ncbi:MAG: riboflavin synthase subunit alpha [Betaproteobacteria bacterium RBG_16_66_20]|nr:MAG: riboflavin synthase subunit alpha [Betaproteobacteria bacterium RBG_16_66_20]
MFTGIVQAVGRIEKHNPLRIKAGRLPLADVRIGDSICVQGCCLTVVKKAKGRLSFDVSSETLSVTAGLDRPGAVNLEKSLALGDRLGGHLVTGHVDGVGRVVGKKGSVYTFEAPKNLARYIARKGSVCVDGVSLTVNRVRGSRFEVNLIPHTLKVTTLGRLARGSKVNLEVDLLARYMEQLLTP